MESKHNIVHGQMIVGTFKKEEEIARAVQLPGRLSGFKRAPVQEGGKEGGELTHRIEKTVAP